MCGRGQPWRYAMLRRFFECAVIQLRIPCVAAVPLVSPSKRSVVMSKREAPIFKVIFLNQGQVYEMYAKQIFQSELWGFLEVEEFVFGERTQMVVDPSEEKLKAQFEGVLRSFVPMHAIIRIDEVERLGTPKISEATGGSNVMPFPMPMPGK